MKECEMEKRIFYNLLFLGLREIVYSIPQEDRIGILKHAYETELATKAKDIGYQIVRLRKEATPDKVRIDELLMQIKKLIKDISYSLDGQFVDGNISAIFEEAKNL